MDTTATTRSIDRILVPLDGSPLARQALGYARGLTAPGADLILLRVVPEVRPPAGYDGPASTTADEIAWCAVDEARQELEQIAAGLRRGATRPRVETVVAVGRPAAQIVTVARRRRAGMIVMASRGRLVAGPSIYGGTADEVVRTATVPVMVVRGQGAEDSAANPRFERLVVPLDGSARAAQALPVAATLAKRLRVPLHLVTVVDLDRILPPALAAETAAGGEYCDGVLAELCLEARQALMDGAAYLTGAGLVTSTTLIRGATVAGIAGATRPGDVIVMTSHGRGYARDTLVGSVAERLIRLESVPVIVLHETPQSDLVVPAFEEWSGATPLQPATT